MAVSVALRWPSYEIRCERETIPRGRRALRHPRPARGAPQPTGGKAEVTVNGTLVNEFLYEEPPAARSGSPDTRPIRKTIAAMDLVVFLPLLLIMGAFMFFASRRQKKAMQATIDLHNSLQIGDRVHTTSGLQATITGITDDNVDLEIAPGVVTTWMKLAIRDRVVDDVDDDFDDDHEDSTDDFEPRSTATEITDRPNSKD